MCVLTAWKMTVEKLGASMVEGGRPWGRVGEESVTGPASWLSG